MIFIYTFQGPENKKPSFISVFSYAPVYLCWKSLMPRFTYAVRVLCPGLLMLEEGASLPYEHILLFFFHYKNFEYRKCLCIVHILMYMYICKIHITYFWCFCVTDCYMIHELFIVNKNTHPCQIMYGQESILYKQCV